ncbi:uncharacterized protein TNCV_4663391 [Trichonephila clavipes]|uniref:Uncharacterized protein n=1 Tax=Trichonephila clavipes TaxID=2585209 RepID=A0A8X6SCZ7_TRICX|nr:uncharacterized protein TNCV_4663391 [Trichonephila clavipes]
MSRLKFLLLSELWKFEEKGSSSVLTLADGAKQSFSLRVKNQLRIFTLRLTGGAHRYHCSRRKQKPTSDINKALTGGAHRYHCSRRKQKPTSDIKKVLMGGAQRTSLNQSPGDQNRGFSTADSHWLSTRASAVLAISLRCQSMFRYFTARLEILTLKLGEYGATSVVLLVTQLKFQITRSMSVPCEQAWRHFGQIIEYGGSNIILISLRKSSVEIFRQDVSTIVHD